jgi:Uma2 family endonuclease
MWTVSAKLMTAEELLQLPSGLGKVYELVNGELITMAPAGEEHGGIAMDIGYFLRHFVGQHRLGRVYAAETGFIIRRNPDTVRAPDTAFVSNERLEKYGRPKRGYFAAAPDLAVEVLSPDQSQNEIDSKIDDYFEGGARTVWVVNPRRKTVMVYRSPQEVRLLTAKDCLDGEDVLPGFTCPLADIFPEV